MEDDILQDLSQRVLDIESKVNKDSFSAQEVLKKYINVMKRLKIPVCSTDPTVGSIGDIVCVVTTLKICTATTPTWVSLLTTTGDGSGLTNLPPLQSSFTAGETLALGDPVRVSSGASTIYSQTSTGDAKSIQKNATYSGKADKFTVGALGCYVTTITVKLHKSGSPSDNLTVSIVNDNSGDPTGSGVKSVNKAGADLTTSATDYDLTFNQYLNEGTYWVTMVRSGATDDSNLYLVTGASEVASANARYALNDINWPTTNSARSYLIINSSDGTAGRIVKALATYQLPSRLIGFAKAAITSGESGTVVLSGIVTGLSSLTTGAVYYLQNDGTLGTAVGTITRKAGIALSATTLLTQLS